MKKFENKTLLVLGSNVMAAEAVTYARRNGAHTIVADYYPSEKSAAKRVADESVLISTAETGQLIEFCRQRGVDGLFAGIGEFNLLQAMRVSQALGLRFYFNQEQWDLIEKKDQFRKLCMRFDVPCPAEYFSGEAKDLTPDARAGFRFPLVVKPVDCAASTGVCICKKKEALDEALKTAFEASGSGRIIVESFAKGHEFTAHFTICNGRAAFACIDNRYPVAVHAGDVTTIPVARIYPSIFIQAFEEKVVPAMLSLCEGIGLVDAVLFIQGMYDEETGAFNVFEAGLRSAAESPCRFMEKITGLNYLDMLVDYILLGTSDYDISKERPGLDGHCCGVVSLVTTGGRVGSIEGLEETVAAMPSVIQYESRYPVGTDAPSGDTLRQLMIRFVMLCDSRQSMERDIAYINDHVFVNDVNGNNMVIKMVPERVYGLD